MLSNASMKLNQEKIKTNRVSNLKNIGGKSDWSKYQSCNQNQNSSLVNEKIQTRSPRYQYRQIQRPLRSGKTHLQAFSHWHRPVAVHAKNIKQN